VDAYKDPYKDAKMVHYKAFEQTVHRSRSTVGTLGKKIQEHAEALRAGDYKIHNAILTTQAERSACSNWLYRLCDFHVCIPSFGFFL
jgi:hypothetical protein